MSQDNPSGIANPAPLGLMGFGMTTVLLNIHNAGFYPVSTMIIAMGVFYGGFAQIVAGIMEFRKGATFGATAFTSYGSFWLTLAAIFVFGNVDPVAMGCYLAMWGVFTLYMFIGTLRQTNTNKVIFGSLVILFGLLAASKWIPGDTGAFLGKVAGWEGIFCGFSAIYGACAQILNETYGKKVLPL